MKFIHEDFLLETPQARRLYHEHAAPQPIIDYHCHLPPAEIAEDKRWSDIAELWLGGDHYKWRAMRTAGVGERFCTGDATPTDIEIAVEHGCRLLKLFPASQLGGLTYLRAMAAPYEHLGLRYIPLGGLTAANAAEYLDDPLIAAIGGSWIAPRDFIQSKNWPAITDLAREAAKLAVSRRISGGNKS
jgi:hypothetical protein